jgi:hypothetical protein
MLPELKSGTDDSESFNIRENETLLHLTGLFFVAAM